MPDPISLPCPACDAIPGLACRHRWMPWRTGHHCERLIAAALSEYLDEVDRG